MKCKDCTYFRLKNEKKKLTKDAGKAGDCMNSHLINLEVYELLDSCKYYAIPQKEKIQIS